MFYLKSNDGASLHGEIRHRDCALQRLSRLAASSCDADPLVIKPLIAEETFTSCSFKQTLRLSPLPLRPGTNTLFSSLVWRRAFIFVR